MQIINLTDQYERIWDAFVHASDEAWFLHLRAFQKVVCQAWNLRDLSFMVCDDLGTVLAVVPLQITETRGMLFRWRILASNALGPCGPTLKNSLSTTERGAVYTMIRVELLRLAHHNDVDEIYLGVPALAPASIGNTRSRVNPLLSLGCDNEVSQTYIIDLEQSEKRIWSQMQGRCRTAVRKALDAGVEVVQAESLADIEVYYDLHRATYARTGVRPHPFDYFRLSWELLGPPGIANFFLAKRGRSVVAAINVGAYKSGCNYWTGASLISATTPGANNLLQWHAMQWAKAENFRYYEVGEGFPNAQSGKKKGLHDFKRSFGGSLYPLYTGRIRLSRRKGTLIQLLTKWRRTGSE